MSETIGELLGAVVRAVDKADDANMEAAVALKALADQLRAEGRLEDTTTVSA